MVATLRPDGSVEVVEKRDHEMDWLRAQPAGTHLPLHAMHSVAHLHLTDLAEFAPNVGLPPGWGKAWKRELKKRGTRIGLSWQAVAILELLGWGQGFKARNKQAPLGLGVQASREDWCEVLGCSQSALTRAFKELRAAGFIARFAQMRTFKHQAKKAGLTFPGPYGPLPRTRWLDPATGKLRRNVQLHSVTYVTYAGLRVLAASYVRPAASGAAYLQVVDKCPAAVDIYQRLAELVRRTKARLSEPVPNFGHPKDVSSFFEICTAVGELEAIDVENYPNGGSALRLRLRAETASGEVPIEPTYNARARRRLARECPGTMPARATDGPNGGGSASDMPWWSVGSCSGRFAT